MPPINYCMCPKIALCPILHVHENHIIACARDCINARDCIVPDIACARELHHCMCQKITLCPILHMPEDCIVPDIACARDCIVPEILHVPENYIIACARDCIVPEIALSPRLHCARYCMCPRITSLHVLEIALSPNCMCPILN
ncbi:hypothetical protein KY285_010554 [Solanum tuberosum]|nr:hypothetical protein KY285_010554 [Solanum tuberosum]